MLARDLTCMGDYFSCDRLQKVDLPEVTLKELYSIVVFVFGEEPFTFLTGKGRAGLDVTNRRDCYYPRFPDSVFYFLPPSLLSIELDQSRGIQVEDQARGRWF